MSAYEREDSVVGSVAALLFAQDKIVETAVDGTYLPHMAELLTTLLQHKGVEHSVARLEFRGIVATVDLAATVHHQYRDTYLRGILHSLALSTVDSSYPRHCDRGGIDHLPVGVVGPFAIILLKKRVGISIAMPLLDLSIGENLSEETDGRRSDVTHEGIEIPFEEGTVGDDAVDSNILTTHSTVESHSKATGGVSAKCNVGISVAPDLHEGGVDIRKILLLLTDVERVLPRFVATAIATQINSIEVVAGIDETLSHLGLKEIVVEAMNIQESTSGALLIQQSDNCGAARAVESLPLIYIPGLISLKDIGMPCGVGDWGLGALVFLIDIPSRSEGGREDKQDEQKGKLSHMIRYK